MRLLKKNEANFCFELDLFLTAILVEQSIYFWTHKKSFLKLV